MIYNSDRIELPVQDAHEIFSVPDSFSFVYFYIDMKITNYGCSSHTERNSEAQFISFHPLLSPKFIWTQNSPSPLLLGSPIAQLVYPGYSFLDVLFHTQIPLAP